MKSYQKLPVRSGTGFIQHQASKGWFTTFGNKLLHTTSSRHELLCVICPYNLHTTVVFDKKKTLRYTTPYGIRHPTVYDTLRYTTPYGIRHPTVYDTLRYTTPYGMRYPTVCDTLRHTTPYGIRHPTAYDTLRHTTPYGIRRPTVYDTLRYATPYGIRHPTVYDTLRHTTPYGIRHHTPPPIILLSFANSVNIEQNSTSPKQHMGIRESYFVSINVRDWWKK